MYEETGGYSGTVCVPSENNTNNTLIKLIVLLPLKHDGGHIHIATIRI